MFRRWWRGLRGKDDAVDRFLTATKAHPRSPVSPLGGLTTLGRGGYLLSRLLRRPQDLDLVRRHLKWTPAQRLRNLEQVHAFVKRARAAPFRPGASGSNATEH